MSSVSFPKTFSLFGGFFLALLIAQLTASLSPVAAQTQAWSEGVCVENGVATVQGLQCLIGNLLSVSISGIGLIGFVMFIVGAFRYMLSGGNAKGTEGGKNTITFAVVGLVLALSAFMILNIIAQFTGISSILEFKIPTSQ